MLKTCFPFGCMDPCLTTALAFQSDVFSISLDNGTVVMNVKGTKVQSTEKQYHDGLPHFIITSVSPARYSLSIRWLYK